ncbi:polymorphic toxin type 23 domain-containing protein [Ulvibacterium marinum]|uniref:Bacterial toxin 23 domain-containing protein n=1 Tax=Ulvibacterium marinum TaxID=2419782 RepID=A0A3B0BV70_9FLAO|nr:polymorphic toxin type 23 domain-containing protein [Ulvibacterium marinum]RKN76822.1 hypothetical protein D7Z94_23865 [Ulvibacterium marinum]
MYTYSAKITVSHYKSLLSRKHGSFSDYRYGFQGQEMDNELKGEGNSLNYKYRMHDPRVGRFFAVDPLADEYPYYSTYAFSGNRVIDATEQEGQEPKILYDLAKLVSPFTVRFTHKVGTHETGIGVETSIGLPKILPFSIRKNYSATFFADDALQDGPVVETTNSKEVSYLSGLLSVESKVYNSGETSQTTGTVTIGSPIINAKYENDWFDPGLVDKLDPFDILPAELGDGGDRFRTARVDINLGPFSTGFKLGTGDPGLDKFERRKNIDFESPDSGPFGTYRLNPDTGDNPDNIRLGIGYFGIGPFKVGTDSEKLRDLIQNKIVHDRISKSPRFKVIDKESKSFIEISNE